MCRKYQNFCLEKRKLDFMFQKLNYLLYGHCQESCWLLSARIIWTPTGRSWYGTSMVQTSWLARNWTRMIMRTAARTALPMSKIVSGMWILILIYSPVLHTGLQKYWDFLGAWEQKSWGIYIIAKRSQRENMLEVSHENKFCLSLCITHLFAGCQDDKISGWVSMLSMQTSGVL